MAQQQESYEEFVHRVSVRWDIFRICDKYKNPAMGFPKYGSDDDWLLRRLNTGKDGWFQIPEVQEGFSYPPAGTKVLTLVLP